LDFNTAHTIDKNLKADEVSENIQNYVLQTHKLIKNQCGIKAKKLSQLVNTIPKNLKENINYNITSIDKLEKGDNNKSMLLSAKAIQSLPKEFEVPL
jgi:hypothetical protein